MFKVWRFFFFNLRLNISWHIDMQSTPKIIGLRKKAPPRGRIYYVETVILPHYPTRVGLVPADIAPKGGVVGYGFNVKLLSHKISYHHAIIIRGNVISVSNGKFNNHIRCVFLRSTQTQLSRWWSCKQPWRNHFFHHSEKLFCLLWVLWGHHKPTYIYSGN